MASSGKKKGKAKGKTMNLNEFLVGDDGAAGPGASYVMANKPSRDWGDAMSDEENNPSSNSYDYGVPAVNRAILPTAPKAARGPDCDMSLIPDRPPFTAFLGNLAYDCEEEDILEFFKGLKVSTVRLPQDQGRLKGFGYAEFEDRQSLLNALNLNNELLKNRKLRVDVAGHQDGGRDNRDGGRGGRSGGFDTGGDPDRSDEMNWRSRDPATAGGFSGGRSSFGGDRDRGFGGDRDRGFGGDRDRGFGGDRDRGYGGNRDRGFGGDRDRGFGGDRGYDRDRGGFGGDRDRGFGGDRDRGYGGDRDRGYGGGRDGGYNRDRGYGGDSGRSYGGRDSYGDRDGGRRPFGSGYNRDSDRDGGDRYGPPRDRYRDRYERRDEDSHETSDAPKERPKLHLAPRSKPADDAPGRSSSIFGDAKPVDTSAIDRAPAKPADAAPAQPPKERPSIFGAAKPVDTASKEREVEERLQKQHEEDHKKFMEERERREGGGHSRRPRRDSDHSDDHGEWERKPRERRTSSSSSGKVISPPSSNRRDSERSNPAEVFDEDKPEQSAAKSPTIKKEEVSVRPAPPPAENVWAKRMSQQNTSPPTKPSEEAPRRDDRPPAKEESDSPRDAPSQQPKDNAWTKGKPDFVPAEPPKENAWRKRSDDGQRPAHQNSQPYREDRNSDNRRPGGRGAPKRSDDSEGAWGRGSGQRGRGGRGGGRGRGEGYGRSERPHRERQERPSPKSIDDMPQYKEDKSKDFSDRNVFSLLDDEQ